MPQELPAPVLADAPKRYVTSVAAHVPIGGAAQGTAAFTVRESYEDGTHFDYCDGSVSFTPAELAALPSYAAFFTELAAAAYAKRSAYDT